MSPAVDTQRRIFNPLQNRLLEATEDVFFDVAKVGELSQAAAYAAETIASLEEGEE